jgi:hypothetical protein
MRIGKEHFLIRKLGAIQLRLNFFAESRITPFLSNLGLFRVHATISRCSHDLGTKQAVGVVKSLSEPRSCFEFSSHGQTNGETVCSVVIHLQTKQQNQLHEN